MSKKVSLKDIAKEVGVSTALVSYVLNNLKEGRISKEVSARIRDVARRLNYRPNQIARSLKTQKTYTIGLIVADISNPFSSAVARIIEDEASHLNYTVIFGSSDEHPGKFEKLVDTFIRRQVDGLILSPPAGSEKVIQQLIRQEVPLVLLDRYFKTLKTNYVVLNNHGASYAATKYLMDAGCKKIAMISYHSELQHLQERGQGYIAALTDAGITAPEFRLKKISINNDPGDIETVFNELLESQDPPDGFLFASNVIALRCLMQLNQRQANMPENLMIVCFDETESLKLFHAPLTFVRQPLREMGRMATRILLENLARQDQVTQVQLEADLVQETA